MVQFNELKVNNEGTKLIIDVSVKNQEYYQNVYLASISIDTQDTFIDGGPSTSTIYNKTIDPNQKSIRLELGTDTILSSLSDNMFFVWVKTSGAPSPTTPCGEDNSTVLGVAIPLYPLYQKSLEYIKEIDCNCKIPKNFINFILQLKALQISVKTGHYTQAINYWKKFFKNIQKTIGVNRCI